MPEPAPSFPFRCTTVSWFVQPEGASSLEVGGVESILTVSALTVELPARSVAVHNTLCVPSPVTPTVPKSDPSEPVATSPASVPSLVHDSDAMLVSPAVTRALAALVHQPPEPF